MRLLEVIQPEGLIDHINIDTITAATVSSANLLSLYTTGGQLFSYSSINNAAFSLAVLEMTNPLIPVVVLPAGARVNAQ
jgi:hypothetical protein